MQNNLWCPNDPRSSEIDDDDDDDDDDNDDFKYAHSDFTPDLILRG